MTAPARRFGELATARGWLAPADVDAALAAQGELARLGLPERVGEILRKRGLLTGEQVREILLEQGAGPLRDLVPGYEIVERLGQGGMGAVYRAHRRADGAAVALKLLPPRLGGNPEFVARFLREARAVAALRHANIVAGLDAGCADDHYFVAMELVEGESLDTRLRRVGTLPEPEVLAIGLAVARALHYAHGQGLVHRDVKPGNILLAHGFDGRSGLSSNGAVKLCDLGLAKWVADGGTAVTQTGLVVGTPQYVAPEQALGDPDVDIRADLYALGATLYHAATGRPPFTGGSGPDVALRRLVADPTPVREANPALSPGLASLIDRLLARRPADRPRTPDAVVATLEAMPCGGGPAPERPQGAADATSAERAEGARARERRGAAPSGGGKRSGPPSATDGEGATDGPSVVAGRTVGLSVAAAVVGALAVGSLAVAWGWSGSGDPGTPPSVPGPPAAPEPAAGEATVPPDRAAMLADLDAARAELQALADLHDEFQRLLAEAAATGRADAVSPEVLATLRGLPAAIERLRARVDDLTRRAQAPDPGVADRLLRDLERPARE